MAEHLDLKWNECRSKLMRDVLGLDQRVFVRFGLYKFRLKKIFHGENPVFPL